MSETEELWQKHVDRCKRITDRDIEENELRRVSPLAERWRYLDEQDRQRKKRLSAIAPPHCMKDD